MTMGKGSDWERRFGNHLEDAGWGVMRSGGSGGGTSGDRPDLIVGNGAFGWVVEHKFASSRNIYLDEQEVEQIRALADAWQMEAVVVLRWNTRQVDAAENADWYPVIPSAGSRTDSGKYSYNVESIQSSYPPLDYYLDSDTG